jgi:hypothetical protein
VPILIEVKKRVLITPALQYFVDFGIKLLKRPFAINSVQMEPGNFGADGGATPL